MKLSKPTYHPSWRMLGSNTDLPIYDPNSIIARRIARLRSKQKLLIPLIPLIVLACLFILWFLPSAANVEIKDGRVTAVHQMETLKSPRVTERLIDHTVLAATTTRNASIPLMIQTPKNIHAETVSAQPANEPGTLPPSLHK